jgi:hypothetical protein
MAGPFSYNQTLNDCLMNYFAEIARIQSEPNPLLGTYTFGEVLDVYLHRMNRLRILANAVVACTPRPLKEYRQKRLQ